jgi:hypothetical protein
MGKVTQLVSTTDQELIERLSKKASDMLDKQHSIVISHPVATATISYAFISELLEEAEGWNLLIRKDEIGNIIIAKEATQLRGYDDIITFNKQ